MSSDEKLLTATRVALGAAGGIAAGLTKAQAAPNTGNFVANHSAKFFHGATRELAKNHKGLSSLIGAAGAGTLAAAGPAVGPALILAAPAVAATAVAVGASFGVYKLVKYIQDL